MRFRPQRRMLDEAMAEMREVNTWPELMAVVRAELTGWHTYTDDEVKVEPYGGTKTRGHDDDRIGWTNVHIITVERWGVVGFVEWGDAFKDRGGA